MRDVKFSRFYIEEEHFDLYQEIESDPSFALEHHPEVFLLSACLGYECAMKSELSKPKELTLLSSFLNLEGAQEIYDAFRVCAQKLEFTDRDGSLKVNTLIEQYAKSGFEKLYFEILAGPVKKDEALVNHMMLKLRPE